MNTTGKALHQFNPLPETRFDIWLLGRKTWDRFVLEVVINDLPRLIDSPKPSGGQIMLDVGYDQGKLFIFLNNAFNQAILTGFFLSVVEPQRPWVKSRRRSPLDKREETLLNLIAVKLV
jgi:hypothetical protein